MVDSGQALLMNKEGARPLFFVKKESRVSEKFLQEGDVFMLTESMKVDTSVPRHFAVPRVKGDFTLVQGSVYPLGELAYLQGRYIVTRTEMTGGSRGSGNANNDYPDGHQVTAVRDDGAYTVKFFQSGYNPDLVVNVPVIARAVQRWVIEDGQQGPQ
jgi:hypothetical protein